jgi:hypothetical protein
MKAIFATHCFLPNLQMGPKAVVFAMGKALHSGRLRPYWQTLVWARRLARDKHSSLFISHEENEVLRMMTQGAVIKTFCFLSNL